MVKREKSINVNTQRGILSSVEHIVTETTTIAKWKDKFIETDFALLLLALDDSFRTLRELKAIAHPDVSLLNMDKMHGFLKYFELKGWIEVDKDSGKHKRYKRINRVDESLSKFKK